MHTTPHSSRATTAPTLLRRLRHLWLASGFFAATSASAAVLYHQGFNHGDTYGNFPAIGGPAPGWTMTADLPPVYLPASLPQPIIQGVGGSLITHDASGDGSLKTLEHPINLSLAGKNEIWVSALVAMMHPPRVNSRMDLIVTVKHGASQSPTDYAVGKNWSDGDTGLRFQGTLLNGAAFATHGQETMHVVYRLAKTVQPEVWINPTGTPAPGTGQKIGSVVNDFTSLNRLLITYRALAMRVDEIVVADDYASILGLLGGPPPSGGVEVLIDFGATATTTGGSGWNNFTNVAVSSTPTALVASNGLPSGFGARVITEFQGASTAGAQGAIGDFPASAVRDSFYTSGTRPNPRIEFTGLNPGQTYGFDFVASLTPAGDARVTRYTVAGATTAHTILNASNNAANIATLGPIAPDSTGKFVLTVSKDPTSTNVNNFIYLGGLRLSSTQPPSVPIVPLTVQDDQFVAPGGAPVRLWGVNAVAFFPSRSVADGYAERLAALGVNCVRWHHLQRPSLDWNTKSRIKALSRYETDSRTPDPYAWDRFDYLNAKLREKGIYVMFSAEFSRRYHPGDVSIMPVNSTDDTAWSDAMTWLNNESNYVDPSTGQSVPGWKFSIDLRKMLHVFDERLARLGEEFLAELLDHVNPYTGIAYGHDSQVIGVELLNEFSSEYVIYAGNKFIRMDGGVNRIAYWNNALLQKWTTFANARGVAPGDFYAPTTAAQREARSDFLNGLDQTYAQRMKTLVTALGYAKPIVFSNLWRGERPLKLNATENHYIEDHLYPDPYVVNAADDWVRSLTRTTIAGRPFFLGEVNQRESSSHFATDDPRRTMFPATFATYGLLHGWSGFAWFAMNHGDAQIRYDGLGQTPGRVRDFGNLANDQMLLDHMRTGSRIFRRGLFARSSGPATMWVDDPIWQFSYNGLMAPKYNYQAGWQSVCEVRKAFGPKPSSQNTAPFMTTPPAGNPLVSDTGQIRKDTVRK